MGKNFFANYNCTILDVAKVTIGDNCFMAPNVEIHTAGHPIYPGLSHGVKPPFVSLGIEKTEKNLKEKISYDGLKEKLNGGSQKHRN